MMNLTPYLINFLANTVRIFNKNLKNAIRASLTYESKFLTMIATEELSGITEILSRTDLTPRHRADFYEKRERSGKKKHFMGLISQWSGKNKFLNDQK